MTPDQIRTLRQSLGMSQKAFGLALGLSPDSPDNAGRTVRRFESGDVEPRLTLVYLMTALEDGYNAEWVDWSKYKSPP